MEFAFKLIEILCGPDKVVEVNRGVSPDLKIALCCNSRPDVVSTPGGWVNRRSTTAIALTIAGSDSGGGCRHSGGLKDLHAHASSALARSPALPRQNAGLRRANGERLEDALHVLAGTRACVDSLHGADTIWILRG